MFYGRTFIFDEIPSENYNLRILDFNSRGSLVNSPAGSESTIHQTWLYRKPKPYFYGKSLETPLSFDLTIGSYDPITGLDRALIEKWLLGRNTFLPLQICQDDIADVYFNVMFTSAENIYVGNVHQGLILHAQCDAPYGYLEEEDLAISVSGNGVVTNKTFTFYNASDDTDYLYPKLTIVTNDIATSFSLINNTDGSREFRFGGSGYENISPNETLTVDNYYQTIVSNSGLNRLSRFNKKWFRLLSGENSLTMVGGLTSFTITYQFAKKIGA